MSEQKSEVDHDKSERSKTLNRNFEFVYSEESKPSLQDFQFIDQSSNDPALRRKNLVLARSHVSRRRNRARGRITTEKRLGTNPLSPAEKIAVTQDLCRRTPLASINSSLLESDSWPRSRHEKDIESTSTLRWSPTSKAMIHHMVTVILGTLFPAVSPHQPPAAAIEVWQAIRSSSMLLHSSVSGAAVHYDSERQVGEYANSTEVLVHRAKALRLINNELSGLREDTKPSDALLLSVLILAAERSLVSSNSHVKEDAGRSITHPFRLRLAQKGWEHKFQNLQYCMAHHHGLFALVARSGGLAALQNRAIAKMISRHDLLLAAMELRAPREPYVHDEEVASLLLDPTVNVMEVDLDLEEQENYTPGGSLYKLQDVVCTGSQLASVLTRLHQAMITADALARDAIRNVNVRVLVDEKEALHHAILSVPSGCCSDPSLYEPVRLATLVFDVGIVFPQPPATGALSRVVCWMKVALESVDIENINKEDGILTWILFVGGVAAKGLPDRVWFVERLNQLMEGVTTWPLVKQLLRSFVWMPDAMDGEAMNLWDEVRTVVD